MSEKKKVVLLGASGSIGDNALEVIRHAEDSLELIGIAGATRTEKLAEIARNFRVPHVCIGDEDAFLESRKAGIFSAQTHLCQGREGLEKLATLPDADIVLIGVVGTAGLHPALAAIEAGKNIALASKEILVLAGKFVMAAARRKGVKVIPVDSEHNALFQCLEGHSQEELERLILTASGGAFLDRPLEDLAAVKPADALRHPNWDMGPKITVDSATMANKGLEMIEALWLFDVEPAQIEVVVHRQSIIHSMVEFIDGSILAQLSPPSMTFAIQHALLYPKRGRRVQNSLDFSQLHRLDLAPPDESRFPCLGLARQALISGGVAPALYNAANEIAVEAFLKNLIPFLEIPRVIDKTLGNFDNFEPQTLEEVLAAEESGRAFAASLFTS